MPRPRGRPRKTPVTTDILKLSVSERENLREEVKEREEVLKNVDGLEHTIQDTGKMANELQRKKEILDRDESLVAKGRDKDRLVKEIKEIEERILKDRPTTEEMNLRLGTHESENAVQKNIRFHRIHSVDMSRLQNLRKRLEPENPRAEDLEYARPDAYKKRQMFFV